MQALLVAAALKIGERGLCLLKSLHESAQETQLLQAWLLPRGAATLKNPSGGHSHKCCLTHWHNKGHQRDWGAKKMVLARASKEKNSSGCRTDSTSGELLLGQLQMCDCAQQMSWLAQHSTATNSVTIQRTSAVAVRCGCCQDIKGVQQRGIDPWRCPPPPLRGPTASKLLHSHPSAAWWWTGTSKPLGWTNQSATKRQHLHTLGNVCRETKHAAYRGPKTHMLQASTRQEAQPLCCLIDCACCAVQCPELAA